MDEKNAMEELQFIHKVIEEAKKSVVYNGKGYISWGLLVIVGMLSTYIFHIEDIYFNYLWVWVVLIPIGIIYSAYDKSKIREKHTTYAGKLLSNVWTASGIAMIILGILGTSAGEIHTTAIIPITCIVMGSAYFISGKIIETKWLTNLSVGWWLGGIVLFYITTFESFLIMAFLMLFLQTIPGIILYRKYNQGIKITP